MRAGLWLGIALAVVFVGWLLGKALRFGTVKALRAFNFQVLTQRSGVDDFLQQGGTSKDTSDLFGMVVFWAVLLASIVIASSGLGLVQVTELLGRALELRGYDHFR